MSGRNKVYLYVMVILTLGLLLTACAAPEPVVEVVKETVVVTEKEEVLVTPTMEPAPESPTLAKGLESGLFYVGNIQEPPFSYVDAEGVLTGIDADIARYISNELGVEDLVSVHTAWDGLIPGLLAGRTDMLAVGMAIRPQRCEVVAFTNPYHILAPTALVEKGNPFDVHSFGDIATHTDLMAGGMSGSVDAEVLREFLPEDQILTYDEISWAFEDLKAGRLDVVIGSSPSLNDWLIGTDMGDQFEIASAWEWPVDYIIPSGLVFRQEDLALVEMANEILEQMKVDGTMVQIANDNGFPVDTLAPPCAELEVGCMSFYCPAE